MHAALPDHATHQAENPNIFNDLTNSPWFILQDSHEQVKYQFDGIAEFFGQAEEKYDGIGLSFESNRYYQPGEQIDVGIPLPESIRSFAAEVVTSEQNPKGYTTGIYLRIESECDLLTLLRSSDYLNIRHTS